MNSQESDKFFINNRYEVIVEEALPQFDAPPALAYRARDLRREFLNIYAISGDPLKPPRKTMLNILKARSIPSMVELLDWAPIWWKDEERVCPVAIFNSHLTETLIQSLQALGHGLSEKQISDNLVNPAIRMLQSLREFNLTHRSINPYQIYWSVRSQDQILFAACAMAKPAMNQLVAYDPLTSAMALPIARGVGTITDDLFSLGVTIGVANLGYEPWAKLSDHEIITRRLERNSYYALFENINFPPGVAEVVRGLTNDQESERWTITELSEWAEGRRMPARQLFVNRRARRALKLFGRGCFSATGVAWQLAQNWQQSVHLVDSKNLMNWLLNDLGDQEIALQISALQQKIQSIGSNDTKLALLVQTLLPNGPIIYKWLSARVDGLGTAYSILFDDQDMHTIVKNIDDLELIRSLIHQTDNVDPHLAKSVQIAINAMRYIYRTEVGEGPARALYEFDPETFCHSNILKNEFVINIAMLLPSIDRYLEHSDEEPSTLIDAHIAAYLMSNIPNKISQNIQNLTIANQQHQNKQTTTINIKNRATMIMMECHLLINIKLETQDNKPYYNICQWLLKQMEPCVQQFHSRALQQQMRKKLKTVAGVGDIEAMLNLFNDKKNLLQDANGFRLAQQTFNLNTINLNDTNRSIINRPKIAGEIGGQISLTICGLTACLSLTALSITYLL